MESVVAASKRGPIVFSHNGSCSPNQSTGHTIATATTRRPVGLARVASRPRMVRDFGIGPSANRGRRHFREAAATTTRTITRGDTGQSQSRQTSPAPTQHDVSRRRVPLVVGVVVVVGRDEKHHHTIVSRSASRLESTRR